MSKRTRTRPGHGNPTKERERRQQRTPKTWHQECRTVEPVEIGDMAVAHATARHHRAGVVVTSVGKPTFRNVSLTIAGQVVPILHRYQCVLCHAEVNPGKDAHDCTGAFARLAATLAGQSP